MHIIYFLLFTLVITNYSFAQTREEYFVREKSKGFIGKVGKSGIYDRYRDTMVLHEGSDGQVTIYGVAYMPSYTRRPYIISLKFDRDKNIYTVGHTSRAFESISDFKLFEIDGTKKLFLVAKQDFEHKLVELDLETLNVISNKKIPNVSRGTIPGFEYGDADNDGIKEFVFGSSDGLQALDPESLEEKFVISFDNDIFEVDGTFYRPGNDSFKIDNVDSDSNNEIIVNGFPSVIEVNTSLEMKLEMRL